MTCAENNPHVIIGKEGYMLSADGSLMPVRKNQPPPDLRSFNQSLSLAARPQTAMHRCAMF
jgi:hypothetical protein